MFVSTHEVVPQPASGPTTPRGWRCPRQVSRLWAPGRVSPWRWCWCSQGFVAAGDLLEPWNDINGKAYINLHLYQRILAQMCAPQTESMETLAPSPSAPQPTSFPRCPCTIRKRHSMPAASRAILFSLMASCDTRCKLSKETYLERFLILLIYWFSVLFSIKGHVPLEIVQFLAKKRHDISGNLQVDMAQPKQCLQIIAKSSKMQSQPITGREPVSKTWTVFDFNPCADVSHAFLPKMHCWILKIIVDLRSHLDMTWYTDILTDQKDDIFIEVLPGKHQVCQNLEHPQTPWFQTSSVHCFSSLNNYNLGVNSPNVHFETVKYHLKSHTYFIIFHIFPKIRTPQCLWSLVVSHLPSLFSAAVAGARSVASNFSISTWRLEESSTRLEAFNASSPWSQSHSARSCALRPSQEVGARKQHVRRLRC